MANNFKFGVSREQVEKEQAKKQRQLEEEIQERTMEKTRKLRQLHSKQKRNRIIVVTLFVVFFLLMATFGTYNTFFKQPLSESQIRQIAIDSTPVQYNSDGVYGYLYDNLETILNRYFDKSTSEETVDIIEIQKDTLRVNKISAISNTEANVEFEVDVFIKYADKKTTDERGESILIEGESFIDTYYLACIVAYDIPVDKEGEAIGTSKVYSFASEVRYFTHKNNNENSVLKQSNSLMFIADGEEIPAYDEEATMLIKTNIENIFINLYAGRDVSTQFKPNRDFSDSTDEFLGFTSFVVYQADNPSGFNCIANYSVKTARGITYKNTCYLKIVKDGTSYKIEKMY